MAKECEIRRENTLPATPEQVWEAVATNQGSLGWMYPREIEPWEGGTVSTGPSTVTAWDPPRKLGIRYDSADGACVVAEYRIETRNHDSTLLCTVIHRRHNGTAGDDWETANDAAGKYTDFYHHTLEQYLRYFSGRPATYLRAQGPATTTEANTSAALRRRLGITDDTTHGDAVRLTPAGLEPVDATVDYLSPDFIGLRTASGLYRFFDGSAWGWPVSSSLHLFIDGADQENVEKAWGAWLEGIIVNGDESEVPKQ